MAIYVDPLFNTEAADKSRWRYAEACHMTADTDDELHAFAAGLGLKREWAQRPGTPGSHYDLTPNKRALAVKRGAIEITVAEATEQMAGKRREEQQWGM